MDTPKKVIRLGKFKWIAIFLLAIALGYGLYRLIDWYPKYQKAKELKNDQHIADICSYVLQQNLLVKQGDKTIPVWILDIERAMATTTK